MRPDSASTVQFHSSHWLVGDVVVCAASPGAQVNKRTRIWAGGLSTVGGKLPS